MSVVQHCVFYSLDVLFKQSDGFLCKERVILRDVAVKKKKKVSFSLHGRMYNYMDF